MQHVKQKDGGDGTPFPPGALLRADSHRLLAGESSHCASAQAGGGRPSSMTDFAEMDAWFESLKAEVAQRQAMREVMRHG